MTAFYPTAIQLFKTSPISGATVTIPQTDAQVQMVMLNHSALLALLSINMPTGFFDGQIIRMTFRSPITVINWSGATVAGSLGSAVVSGYAAFVWDLDNTTWRRCA